MILMVLKLEVAQQAESLLELLPLPFGFLDTFTRPMPWTLDPMAKGTDNPDNLPRNLSGIWEVRSMVHDGITVHIQTFIAEGLARVHNSLLRLHNFAP